MFLKESYDNIIGMICQALNIDKEKLKCIIEDVEDTDDKYMLMLILNKYNCINEKFLQNEFKLENVKLMSKLAEEKLFVDIEFRKEYFDLLKCMDREKII